MNRPKGTNDVTSNNYLWLYLEGVLHELFSNYNYEYMRTPIFENSELFHRGIGEGTDIVSKETYDFVDKGGRNLTLRPELTAGIVRSYIENKLYVNPDTPHKFYSFGPAFRYERPQAGRYRELYQSGVEAFGTKSALLDSEVISLSYNFLTLLGFNNVIVNINCIGDNETRENYKKALVTHLEPSITELCEDCQKRITTNPLRVLDCKIDCNHEAITTAPSILDYLSEESRKYFDELQIYLEMLNVNYEINERLVRGLDYYTDIVFEVIVDTEELGNQNVVAGGGRYDNLVETLGGPSTPGVGFSFGVDRIIQLIDILKLDVTTKKPLDVMILTIDDSVNGFAIQIADALRMSGFKADLKYNNKNLTKNLKKLKDANIRYLMILGEDEIKSGLLKLKNNQTEEEITVNGNELIEWLDKNCKD